MANEVMKRHVSRDDLNSPHQQRAPVSAYCQSIMENRLHRTQECARFYFFTRYIRLCMKNASPTLYCTCLVTVLSTLKRLKSAIAVFVFEQSDFIFLCVSAIHGRRTICKGYVMNCLSILYKTSLGKTSSHDWTLEQKSEAGSHGGWALYSANGRSGCYAWSVIHHTKECAVTRINVP